MTWQGNRHDAPFLPVHTLVFSSALHTYPVTVLCWTRWKRLQKEFGWKYTKSDVSAMFLMGREDSQILWFLPTNKKNTKLEDKKPEVNARRWVLCVLKGIFRTLRILESNFSKGSRHGVALYSCHISSSSSTRPRLFVQIYPRDASTHSLPQLPTAQGFVWRGLGGTAASLIGTSRQTFEHMNGVCCLFWKAITNSLRVGCQLGS